MRPLSLIKYGRLLGPTRSVQDYIGGSSPNLTFSVNVSLVCYSCGCDVGDGRLRYYKGDYSFADVTYFILFMFLLFVKHTHISAYFVFVFFCRHLVQQLFLSWFLVEKFSLQ